MLRKDMIIEIRCMLERHWTAFEIAHKLCLPVNEVEQVVNSLH